MIRIGEFHVVQPELQPVEQVRFGLEMLIVFFLDFCIFSTSFGNLPEITYVNYVPLHSKQAQKGGRV